jgi:hypothetical protein
MTLSSPVIPAGEYNRFMKRTTLTLADDLAEALESYLGTQRTFEISPARKGSGRPDVSQQHDRHLAETQK